MTIKEEALEARMQRRQELIAASGMLGALAASSCCILPLVLFSLGVSGAWIGNFTRLRLISPTSSRRHSCSWDRAIGWFTDRGRAAAPRVKRARGPCQIAVVKATLILATILVAAALGLDLIAPFFLTS